MASFLGMLPRCYPYAFEFRHTSWYEEDVYELLRAHDVSLCLSDHHDAPSPWEVTALVTSMCAGTGPTAATRDRLFQNKTLRAWARHIGNWRRQRRTVFVYFDNDQKSAAPADARRLVENVAATRGADRDFHPRHVFARPAPTASDAAVGPPMLSGKGTIPPRNCQSLRL